MGLHPEQQCRAGPLNSNRTGVQSETWDTVSDQIAPPGSLSVCATGIAVRGGASQLKHSNRTGVQSVTRTYPCQTVHSLWVCNPTELCSESRPTEPENMHLHPGQTLGSRQVCAPGRVQSADQHRAARGSVVQSARRGIEWGGVSLLKRNLKHRADHRSALQDGSNIGQGEAWG